MNSRFPILGLIERHGLSIFVILLAGTSLQCEKVCDIINPPPTQFNFALHFDGENDFVRIPDLNGSLDLIDFTIECWVQIDKRGKIHELVVKDAEGEDSTVNSNYSMDVWSDEKLRIVFENENQDNQEIFGNTILVTGRLYHAAATFESRINAFSLFLNGERDAGPTLVIGRPNQQNQDLRIGTGYEGGPRTTTWGTIDDVRIWNRALSAQEIKDHMNVRLSGREVGLVGNWTFDEGSGQIVSDRSRVQNHGTMGSNSNNDVEPDDPVWVLSTVDYDRSGRQDR